MSTSYSMHSSDSNPITRKNMKHPNCVPKTRWKFPNPLLTMVNPPHQLWPTRHPPDHPKSGARIADRECKAKKKRCKNMQTMRLDLQDGWETPSSSQRLPIE